jgi:hypothetical protein
MNPNEELLRLHIERMAQLNSPNRAQIQEFPPSLAAIVQRLQKNPDLIQKVKFFLDSLPETELQSKETSTEQVMS